MQIPVLCNYVCEQDCCWMGGGGQLMARDRDGYNYHGSKGVFELFLLFDKCNGQGFYNSLTTPQRDYVGLARRFNSYHHHHPLHTNNFELFISLLQNCWNTYNKNESFLVARFVRSMEGICFSAAAAAAAAQPHNGRMDKWSSHHMCRGSLPGNPSSHLNANVCGLIIIIVVMNIMICL